MSAQNRRTRAKANGDPVVAGRECLMPIDPMNPVHIPREELVRRKAYELYEQRGKEDGHALEDWVKAESQIALG